jgi:hypothetical protein
VDEDQDTEGDDVNDAEEIDAGDSLEETEFVEGMNLSVNIIKEFVEHLQHCQDIHMSNFSSYLNLIIFCSSSLTELNLLCTPEIFYAHNTCFLTIH